MLVLKTGLNVAVFAGKDQDEAVAKFVKAKKLGERHIRIEVESQYCIVTKPKASKSSEALEFKINFVKRGFEYPDSVGLQDIQHAGDLLDFHLVFPYDAWLR